MTKESLFGNPAAFLAGVAMISVFGLMSVAGYTRYIFLRSLRKEHPGFWKERLDNPSLLAAFSVFQVPRTVHVQTMRRLEPSCPSCQYSLRGLPVNGKCPECGAEYDRRDSAWDESEVMKLCLKFDKRIKRLKIAMWVAVGITVVLLLTTFFKW